MSPRDAGRTAAAAALLALALLAPALVGGQTVAGYDIGLFNAPALELAAAAWRGGHAPGWNEALGAPYLADPSFYALDPRHLLLLVVAPLTALNLQLALALALGFSGAWALGRELGLSRSAALLAAASFGVGGVQASHLGNPTWAAATGLLPWALLAARRALEPGAPPVRLVVAALPLAADLLGSAPEAAGHAWLAALALALVEGTPVRRAAVRLVAVGALAGGLAAVGLVPALRAVADTDRATGVTREVASLWSLHPLELLGLVVPGLVDGGPLLAATGHLGPAGGRAWLPSIHAGAAAVVLALLALPRAARAPRWRGLLLVGALALLYALGRFGPLQPLVWELFPPLRTFRYPAKAFGPAALTLALLGGLGLDLLRARPSLARAATWALGGLGVVCASGALAAWRGEPSLAGRLLHAALAALLLAGAARRLAAGAPRAARLLALVALVDLLLGARAQLVLGPRALYEAAPRLVADVQAVERRDQAPARVATLGSTWKVGLQVQGLALPAGVLEELSRRESLVPNAAAAHGVRTATAFSSVPPRRLALLRAALRAADCPPLVHARLLGARLAVVDGAAADEVAALEPVAALGPFLLGRVRDAPPWCALVRDLVRAGSPEEAAARVAAPGFDPRVQCVVEDPEDWTHGLAPDVAPSGSARLVALAADRVELAVEAPTPSLLVVREGWGAGWSATVDGGPAPLLPADVLFRAVPVPTGPHRVVLTYEAPGRAAGAALTGLSLLLCLALAALGRRGAGLI